MLAANFLRNLAEAVPYKIHTILTDNGIQFTNRETDQLAGDHIFDRFAKRRTGNTTATACQTSVFRLLVV